MIIKVVAEQGRKYCWRTTKDYQRPQPAEQVIMINADDHHGFDVNHDDAGDGDDDDDDDTGADLR